MCCLKWLSATLTNLMHWISCGEKLRFSLCFLGVPLLPEMLLCWMVLVLLWMWLLPCNYYVTVMLSFKWSKNQFFFLLLPCWCGSSIFRCDATVLKSCGVCGETQVCCDVCGALLPSHSWSHAQTSMKKGTPKNPLQVNLGHSYITLKSYAYYIKPQNQDFHVHPYQK